MDKRYLHHWWTSIRPFHTAYFLAAFVVCALLCVLALRTNYKTMITLRDAVYAADQGTDAQNGNIEQALQRLRGHVGQHMNTSLSSASGVYPPIQLKYTYERLVAAEQARVNAVNSQVYTDAQHFCEARYPASVSGGPRVPCIGQYVKDHGTSAKKVVASAYMFDFASPRWSPDVAGWSLVFAVFFLALGGIRFALGRWLRAATH